jgi:hypothetical protein
MKIKKKIISGLLIATTLVSLCAFSAGAVSTDKKFSVEDATLIQKNVVGMTTFDEKQIKLYDLNKDGVITVVDSTLVQKIIVGLIKGQQKNNRQQQNQQQSLQRKQLQNLQLFQSLLLYLKV